MTLKWGIFFSGKKSVEALPIFSLIWISDCNSIHSIQKFTDNVLMLTENGVKNKQTK